MWNDDLACTSDQRVARIPLWKIGMESRYSQGLFTESIITYFQHFSTSSLPTTSNHSRQKTSMSLANVVATGRSAVYVAPPRRLDPNLAELEHQAHPAGHDAWCSPFWGSWEKLWKVEGGKKHQKAVLKMNKRFKGTSEILQFNNSSFHRLTFLHDIMVFQSQICQLFRAKSCCQEKKKIG